MIKADLHIHSDYSDGSDSIEKIVIMAKNAGLTHISITDHDMLEQNGLAEEIGEKAGIKVISGIEISAIDNQSRKKAHILGYGIQDKELAKNFCSITRERRNLNSLRQIEILKANGLDIDFDELLWHPCIFKQHIMESLVKNGFASEMFGDFYHKIFKNGGICDFDIEYADVYQAVQTVNEAGGLAVLAHSGQQQNFELIEKLIPYGLAGAELYHPDNSEGDRSIIERMCLENGLFTTGGSDYHGIYEAGKTQIGDYFTREYEERLFG
jgi:phosphoribosyl 1,2-cyclic phosphate 1,2-diphosphodiesterase